MLDDTLAKINAVKAELKKLESAHAEKATSVAGFASAAAHEAARKNRSPRLLGLAVQGLEHSAKELEASHPKIAAAVVEICRDLTSLGI